MAFGYDSDQKLNIIMPLLDHYTKWLGLVMRAVFSNDPADLQKAEEISEYFQKWYENALDKKSFHEDSLNNLNALHADMQDVAQKFVNLSGLKDAEPDLKTYDSLNNLYEIFIQKIRRLEKDSALQDCGLDPETSFRNVSAMEYDLNREMDRRNRNGRPFALVVVRLDHFERIKNLGADSANRAVRTFAKIVKSTIRSFDDAYRLDDSHFVLSLKQTDASGADAACMRIKRLINEENVVFKLEDDELPLTTSYSITESAPGDDPVDLVRFMRQDLEDEKGDVNQIVQYQDVSSLKRYADRMES